MEEGPKVCDGTRHGSNGAEPRECSSAGWKMSGGRNAAGSGLEGANTTKMGGDAYRASSIAADAGHGTSGSNGRGFAAAGTSRRFREIPGITGFAGHQIIGFVVHQEFWSVSVPDQDGACGFQASNEWGILRGHVVFSEQRTGGTGPAGYVHAALDGDGNSMKGSLRRG